MASVRPATMEASAAAAASVSLLPRAGPTSGVPLPPRAAAATVLPVMYEAATAASYRLGAAGADLDSQPLLAAAPRSNWNSAWEETQLQRQQQEQQGLGQQRQRFLGIEVVVVV